jgi:hypothetical protein
LLENHGTIAAEIATLIASRSFNAGPSLIWRMEFETAKKCE